MFDVSTPAVAFALAGGNITFVVVVVVAAAVLRVRVVVSVGVDVVGFIVDGNVRVVFITYSTVFNGDPAHPMSRVPDNTLNLNTIN
jgi:hypothetical protein